MRNGDPAQYEGLAKSIARQHAERLGRLDLLEDFEQEARLAVLVNAPDFPKSGWEQNEASRKNWLCFKMRDAIRDFAGRNIDDAISFDEPVSVDGESLTHHEVIGADPDQEGAANRAEGASSLPPEAQRIAAMRAEGRTFGEIAELLGRTSDAVRQILSRAQRRLRKKHAA